MIPTSVFLILSECVIAASATRINDNQGRVPAIKLYYSTECPFSRGVWIALLASGLPFQKVKVHPWGHLLPGAGAGDFNVKDLRKVERKAGHLPTGQPPVISIDDEVIRPELDGPSAILQRLAKLSATTPGAVSLAPKNKQVADDLLELWNAVLAAKNSRVFKRQLIRESLQNFYVKADEACRHSTFLAGESFSIADAIVLPFLDPPFGDPFPPMRDGIPFGPFEHLEVYAEAWPKHKLPYLSITE